MAHRVHRRRGAEPATTAPRPSRSTDDNPDLYGGGYTTGNIAGIPKRAEHPEQRRGRCSSTWRPTTRRWSLLSNGLRNVPTTDRRRPKSPDLKPDPNFETFLKIYANPNTATTPVTAAGSANQELFNTFVDKWQAGQRRATSQGGLEDVDKQIDAQLAQRRGPSRSP